MKVRGRFDSYMRAVCRTLRTFAAVSQRDANSWRRKLIVLAMVTPPSTWPEAAAGRQPALRCLGRVAGPHRHLPDRLRDQRQGARRRGPSHGPPCAGDER
jgi:hypothetical protein